MTSERYCRRCGEDAWNFYRCDECLEEFCDDCAGAECIMDCLCPDCWQKARTLEEADARMAELLPLNRVLPCMREWYAAAVGIQQEPRR